MSVAAAPLLAVARRVNAATIFQSMFLPPEEFDTVEAAAARIRELAGPGALALVDGAAAYPDFDPFLSLTVRKDGLSVCYFADRWVDEQDRKHGRRALTEALA